MTSNATLLSAIHKTVAEILDIPEIKISLPIFSSRRRVLLAGAVAYVSYDFNVTSARTPGSYKQSLMQSVTSGGFITLLHAKSGILLQSTYDLHFDDYSPTFRPTRSPLSDLPLQAGEEMKVVNTIILIIS